MTKLTPPRFRTRISKLCYSHGDQVDQPLVLERGGQSYFYHRDFLGSIRSLTDAAGMVVNEYDYDAYGNFETRIEGVPNPYTFTAREFDAESGLHYYRARYYDANSGRFITEDPIGFASNDLNLYRYAFNIPLMLTDPQGLGPLIQFGALVRFAKQRVLALSQFIRGVGTIVRDFTSRQISKLPLGAQTGILQFNLGFQEGFNFGASAATKQFGAQLGAADRLLRAIGRFVGIVLGGGVPKG